MDVMFTTHPKDGLGKYYMVVATAEEWQEILADLHSWNPSDTEPATDELIGKLKSWGIEP